MLNSPGFGSLLCIVSQLRLFCDHELCVSCPRLFPEEDKVKSGVAHILESHPREQHARVGHPLHGSRIQETKTGKTGPPAILQQAETAILTAKRAAQGKVGRPSVVSVCCTNSTDSPLRAKRANTRSTLLL